MQIPTRPFGLMTKIYRHVLPEVHKQLSYWKGRAEEIPNPELRRQALEREVLLCVTRPKSPTGVSVR